MKTKTADLISAALDWAVAKCEGRDPSHYLGVVRATAHPDYPDSPPMFGPELRYSTDWAQGGPIIERDGMHVDCLRQGKKPIWEAWPYASGTKHIQQGPTPLIAAMRCFVASKLGAEVEVPEELLK